MIRGGTSRNPSKRPSSPSLNDIKDYLVRIPALLAKVESFAIYSHHESSRIADPYEFLREGAHIRTFAAQDDDRFHSFSKSTQQFSAEIPRGVAE
jgi:hypothetical protein